MVKIGGINEDQFTRNWRLWVVLIWCATAAILIYDRWNAIRWFVLTDTDDNLRIAQVRALIAGQDWFDLRQYRLNPPFGADIHWSRLVDLPIAGIKLALAPFLGGALAEKAAVTLAPMLPMLMAMFAIAVAMRRLLSPKAFALGVAIMLCAQSARGMWMPLRIDHHGWQLAMLAVTVMGLTDTRRARGSAIVGLATAISLTIGLEMLLYLALAGTMVGLRWVWDRGEAPCLVIYGASLAGGSTLGFLLFASQANRMPVCDALSPVWLSVMAAVGAFAVLLAWLEPSSRWKRLVAAGAASLLLGAGYVWFWPACVGRLERTSPELDALWLSHVREALPIYRHSARIILSSATLPVIGLAGYAAMLWRIGTGRYSLPETDPRQDKSLFITWASIAALGLLSAALLLWQTRASPAAQLLAVPGAAGLTWLAMAWFQARPNFWQLMLGIAAVFVVVSGLGVQLVILRTGLFQTQGKARAAIDVANARCPSLPALRPIAQLPKGTILTHVDLGPRLIAVTPHDAIAGPYHRNQADIIAVMRAFRGDVENARKIITDRKVDYVLICPNLSESTIYRAEAPHGFYVQLTKGQIPSWLERVPLPANSPYLLWRVKR